MKRVLQLLAVVAITAVAAVATWPRPAVNIRIPEGGIAEVHRRFWRVQTLPETIFVAAGGRPRVRITNSDSIPHRLGLFAADAGETVEYTLPQPGAYTGQCSAHPTSSTLTFVVR
jgi:hypothetical protein